MLPHIPTPETRERFEQLASVGRRPADMQVDYESVDPYPLDVQSRVPRQKAERRPMYRR
nr:hypothetical protein [Rhodococcus qingshengii]